ncbi:MAG: nucleotidyl transferase AbiEii/AbiGii toxin family protein [Gemmataceae bacterium]
MTDRLYPVTVAEIEPWAARHGATRDEARKRFVQFVVLEAVAADAVLGAQLAFKGGNALRFVYGNRRGTLDLDFTADGPLPDDEGQVRAALDVALRRAGTSFGVKVKCQAVKRKPPKSKGTMPTYDIAVGFQFPGERLYPDFDRPSVVAATVVKVEISFNELVCETIRTQLDPSYAAQLRVCTLEDILAEKLRALLQQVVRNRTRPQDVYDIANMLAAHGPRIDVAKVADFLLRKSAALNIRPTRAAFADDGVRSRTVTQYEEALAVNEADRIPFEVAWRAVEDLIAHLQLPE